MMLKIKRVPTVVSNYQKDEADDGSRRGGCGRNCLKECCIHGNYCFPPNIFECMNECCCSSLLFFGLSFFSDFSLILCFYLFCG